MSEQHTQLETPREIATQIVHGYRFSRDANKDDFLIDAIASAIHAATCTAYEDAAMVFAAESKRGSGTEAIIEAIRARAEAKK